MQYQQLILLAASIISYALLLTANAHTFGSFGSISGVALLRKRKSPLQQQVGASSNSQMHLRSIVTKFRGGELEWHLEVKLV